MASKSIVIVSGLAGSKGEMRLSVLNVPGGTQVPHIIVVQRNVSEDSLSSHVLPTGVGQLGVGSKGIDAFTACVSNCEFDTVLHCSVSAAPGALDSLSEVVSPGYNMLWQVQHFFVLSPLDEGVCNKGLQLHEVESSPLVHGWLNDISHTQAKYRSSNPHGSSFARTAFDEVCKLARFLGTQALQHGHDAARWQVQKAGKLGQLLEVMTITDPFPEVEKNLKQQRDQLADSAQKDLGAAWKSVSSCHKRLRVEGDPICSLNASRLTRVFGPPSHAQGSIQRKLEQQNAAPAQLAKEKNRSLENSKSNMRDVAVALEYLLRRKSEKAMSRRQTQEVTRNGAKEP
eukprot:3756242-Amphidinium_carterae.4